MSASKNCISQIKIITFKTAPLTTIPKIVTSKNSPIIPAMTSRVKEYRNFQTSVTTLSTPKSVTSFSSKTRYQIFIIRRSTSSFSNSKSLFKFVISSISISQSFKFLTNNISENATTGEGKCPHYSRPQKKAKALTTTTEESKLFFRTTISDQTIQNSSCASNFVLITDNMS